MASGEVWRLVRGEELVGEIVVEEADLPWLRRRFVPQPTFAEVKPLFDQELELIESGLEDHLEAWEQIYDRIAGTLRLLSPHGPVAEFLLHVEDGNAWFRWSDEPFEERG
ncbi:hypothetical protein AB0K15_05185 [Amycolatopsis sp. NPDC049253]|uniref:hypothetical protein n=1 Tax=Amycolatopsis sp. NPDC049253 TaxID=3155274 RepID=UPI00341D4E60